MNLARTLFVRLAVIVATATVFLPLQQAAAATNHPAAHIAHPLRLQGHVAMRGGRIVSQHALTQKLRQAARRNIAAHSSRHAAEIAIVTSVGRHNFQARFIPWKTSVTHGQKLYSLDGTRTTRGVVTVPAHSWIGVATGNAAPKLHRATSLASLKPGMTVFIGGDVTGYGMRSRVIATLTGGQSHKLTAADFRHAHLTRTPRDQTATGSGTFGGTGPTETGTGSNALGGTYSYNFGDVDIFEIPKVITISLDEFDYTWSLGTTLYDWPINFTATAPDPLYETEHQAVSLQAQPQKRGACTGLDCRYTFISEFGFNVTFTFHVWTFVGCGTADLESCDFYPTVGVGLGASNQTDGAAPLASGTSLDVPAVQCPGVGFGIPDSGLDLFNLNLCFDYNFEGTPLQANVSATGATLDGGTSVPVQMDGVTPASAYLTPTSTSVQLKETGFYWAPVLDYGFNFQITGPSVVGVTLGSYNFPTINIQSGAWPMIGTADQLSQVDLSPVDDLNNPQPTEEDFSFTGTPEPTNVTFDSSGPTRQDYHDSVTVPVQLTDRSGLPVSGEPLYYSIGDQYNSCGTTSGNGWADCTFTPDELPANYTLRVSFPGDGPYASSNTSETFTVLREESSLSIGGDTSGTYGGSVSMNGTLREDAGGPALSGQPIDFNWGYQHCSPEPSTDTSGDTSCSLTLTQGAGSYTAADSFAGNGYYVPSSNSHAVSVSQQAATITLAGSNGNPVQADRPGGTASPTITASFANTLPAGDIQNATVTYTLTPIGPGTTYTCTVTPTGAVQSNDYQSQGYTVSGSSNCPTSITESPAPGTNATSMTQTLTFTGGVETNVYTLSVSVSGAYYTGGPVNGVTTIYDPSLGFTTGGGTVVNPVTGYTGNYGFTAKYLKSGQIQGNVVYIEHRPSGDVTLKSSAMNSLTIVNTSTAKPPYIAYIQGAATDQGVGNYQFRVTAIDNGEPGIHTDQFGLQVTDPSGAIVSDLTFPSSGTTDGSPTISGGNISVAHK